jgi:hypothetical protein
MPKLFHRITDLHAQADVVACRRYGVIEMSAGRLIDVRFRPWPKLASLPETRLIGRYQHTHCSGDRCRLYFNQPLGSLNYLSITYVISNRDTRFSTFRNALCVLEEIAEIKRSDAIICDLGNPRISDRLLDRWGWEPLKSSRWHRQFIKRFYGDFSSRVSVPQGMYASPRRVLAPIRALKPATA